VGRPSHAWTFGLTEANNYLSPQKSKIAFKVQLCKAMHSNKQRICDRFHDKPTYAAELI
jgi:hypothetical protein